MHREFKPAQTELPVGKEDIIGVHLDPRVRSYSGFASWVELLLGGIDEGEYPRDAAIRELKEETGVTSAEVLAEVWPSDLTQPCKPLILCSRAQLHHLVACVLRFLFKFIGNEDEINLFVDGKEKPEFGTWSWMPPERVVELAVDFKRPVYKEVLTVFATYLQM
ncbi:hypothetical protein Nepgr_015100 [Nepenthes gracilis]|uniref:Nudix hydrolase domain-containing protein n=1 Tax=Nepenthes gracilis TaxID=150966 RepID=A0AAD3XQT6_NEPGR|nr:hypothetical protein Nepgr_015100 [Nepenthes gracilis]